MFKQVAYWLLFTLLFTISIDVLAQSSEDIRVIHVQKWKMKSLPTGEDGKNFSDMLKKQSEVQNKDPRLLSFRLLRHFWGADSRDLIMISEFKNKEDLFGFMEDMGKAMEEAMSKEELDKGDALWSKYVGEHSDEIYQEVGGTRK